MSPALRRLFATCSTLLVLAACGDDSTPATRRGPRHPTTPASAAGGAACRIDGQGVRVVVDVSQSMRGFASPRTATLEHVHRAIDESLAAVGIASPIERCRLGESLACERPPTYTDLREPATYGANNCRLDRALRRPPPGDDLASQDVLSRRRMLVLVTDGMQSSSAPARAEDDTACLAGADPSCVRALLRQRVREGYGVWLGLVLLPFAGEYFPERTIDDADLARVQAHLEEAGHHRPYHEAPLSVRRAGRGRGPTSTFVYEGLRPLIVVVVTCDLDAGQRFADGLVSRLRAARVADEGRLFLERLAPVVPSTRTIEGVRREGRTAGELDVGRLRTVGSGPVRSLRVPVSCDTDGRATLRFDVQSTGGTQALPAWLREQVVFAPVGRPLSEAALTRPDAREDDFVTDLRCLRLSAGTHRARFALRTRLRFDASQVGETAWWHTLSAPNSFEMPERAYALEDLASGILDEATRRTTTWAEVELEVDRQ